MIDFFRTIGHLAVWMTLIAAIFAINYFPYKLRMRRYQAIEVLAQKGLPIPPEFLTSRQDSDRQRIQAGTLLVCIGIAAAVFFWVIGGSKVSGNEIPTWLPVIAIFPVMIGLAQFIVVLFTRRLPD